MLDEMDLLSGLKETEPVRPHAFEEARAALQAAMVVEAAPAARTALRRRARWGTRRTVGISAAVLGTAAAAAAVALAVTTLPSPSHNTAASGAPAAKTGAAAKTGPAKTGPAANPVLTQLAAAIVARPAKLPGNATVEIRNQSPAGDQIGANGIDLYTDGGIYYWGLSRADLRQVVAQGQADADHQFQRDMAAAIYAVHGNITVARARMAVANYAPGTQQRSVSAADSIVIQKLKAVDKAAHRKYTPPKPLTPAQRKEQTDSFIWMNATDALTAEPGNADVRAGVLRIMATMPNVKVTHTTTAGQATLTLSDSWPLLDHPVLVESMVINASTGAPVAMSNRQAGQPLNVTYYHDARVTMANVEAGKF